MTVSTNDKVNYFLLDIESVSEQQSEIVIVLRALFLQANASLSEDIKYGGLTFNLAGELVGGIYVYKHHISVEFSQGAEFIDADLMLQGKGKQRRHLKITSLADIRSKNIKYYIQQAVK